MKANIFPNIAAAPSVQTLAQSFHFNPTSSRTSLTLRKIALPVVFPLMPNRRESLREHYYCSFTIFILHSRESELHRYVLDGMSAIAGELLFPRRLGHLSSI